MKPVSSKPHLRRVTLLPAIELQKALPSGQPEEAIAGVVLLANSRRGPEAAGLRLLSRL